MDAVSGRVGAAADGEVGRRIRARRRVRRLSLQQLASLSGLSVGLLSQVERGISSPSLRSLRQICAALGMPMSWLFSDDGGEVGGGIVLRPDRRRRLDSEVTGMVKELLTPDEGGRIQMMLVRLEPGGGSGESHRLHAGEEAGLVMEGAVELVVDGRRFNLEEGDAFRFAGSYPYRFANAGEKPAVILWAVSPPHY